jgi:hypothetical protein
MKMPVIVILFLLCIPISLSAQKDVIKKYRIYRTWIALYDNPHKVKGVLYEIKDSSIVISNSLNKEDNFTDKFSLTELNIRNIDEVETRREGGILRNALIGIAGGFTIGGIIGFASGDDDPDKKKIPFTAKEKALIFGIDFAFIGGISAGLVGSARIEIPINGSFKTFNENKNRLKKYSVIH